MKHILYCGWNGFGQMGDEPFIIHQPTLLPVSGSISSMSCSWSVLSIIIGCDVVMMGYVESQRRVVKTLTFPPNVRLKQISSSTNFTLVCSEDGTCWRYAADSGSMHKVVDFLSTELDETEDVENLEKEKIVKVCCSDYINLALSNSGRVFSIPTAISLPRVHVVDVACGNEHCILLTDNGHVYSWGSGSRGQLGHDELEPEESPRHISALQDVVVTSISCGAWHCAVVTSSGDLFTWGWDCMGQLGRDSSQSSESINQGSADLSVLTPEDNKNEGPVQSVPVPIDTSCDVKVVRCGARHTVVLLEDESVWSCGWNAYGQLGVSSKKCSQSAKLQKIELSLENKKVTDIVCGGWSTCFILECI